MDNKLAIKQNETAIELPGQWTPIGLALPDGLPFSEWTKVGQVLSKMEQSVNWCIGDWLVYAEKNYGETYTEAEVLTGFTYGVLAINKYVASQVEFLIRIKNLHWSHHRLVAPLEQDQQIYWLSLAEQKGWSVSELRRQMKHTALLNAPPPPPGQYRVIYADPPWAYDNSGFNQSAESHYPTMSQEELCTLPVGDLAYERCVLFLWATSPLLPEALEIMTAWGFEYKASRVWIKDRAPGIGWFVKTRHELLLIGVQGEGMHPTQKLDSIFESPVTQHSAKPQRIYEDIESCYEGPYIELFARNTREGWISWGNEV